MFRSLIIATAALCASHAFGADMVPKAAPSVAAPVSASNFYIGAMGVASKQRAAIEQVAIPPSGDLKPAGMSAGAVAGYGGWNGNAFFAVEADAAYDWQKDANLCVSLKDCSVRPTWLMTQRVVVGMTLSGITGTIPSRTLTRSPNSQWPTTAMVAPSLASTLAMPYLTAGVAERRLGACMTGECGKDWITGYVLGGGVRAPLTLTTSFDVSYLYAKYNQDFTLPSQLGTVKNGSEHMFRFGLIAHM